MLPSSRCAVRRGAKALIVEEGTVLLLKERRDDGTTFRSLPGGGIESGETLPECLHRELTEELHCRIDIGEPVGSCLYRHKTLEDTVTLYSVLTAETLCDPVANRAEEVVGYGWHELDRLPPDLLDPFQEMLSAQSL